MTFASHLSRGVALSALALGLSGSAAAQDDGFNFHVLSNFGEVAYYGIGAGSGSTPGVDVTGYWSAGEDMQGGTMTGLGDFGYKQAGHRITACVFNLGVNSRLDFPAVLTTEHTDTDTADGFNFHHPFNFVRPGCGVGTANPGVPPTTTFVFGAPTGAPPGASFQWIIFGLPTGLGIATSALLMSPNNGLFPSATNAGTVAIVSAYSVTAAISAAGCYNFDMNWTATAATSAAAFDNIEGWWTQLTASRDNNQYWTMATDNLNIVNSMGGGSSGGLTAVFTFLAGTDLELHFFSLDPTTNLALTPASYTADNAYYGFNAPGPNEGLDLGAHKAISNSALNGARTIFSGTDPTGATFIFPAGVANAQDTANAGLNIGPTPTGGASTNTIGFVTWNNNTYPTAGNNSARLTWLQTDLNMLAGGAIDPSASADVTVFLGTARVPLRISPLAGAWPSSLTQSFWPFFIHNTVDQTGNTLFPDPTGNPAGTLGVAPIAGVTFQLPVFGASGTCGFNGLPVAINYGSTGLSGTGTGPLIWDNTQNRVSGGRSVLSWD